MEFIGEIRNKLKCQFNETNFYGAIDIIVIQDEENNLASTPFYCKFGNLGIKNPTLKTVEIRINDNLTSNFRMIFLESGDGYYVNNSFKIVKAITVEPKLNDYLKAAKSLENAIMNKTTNTDSKPFFFVETIDDSEESDNSINQEIPISELDNLSNSSLLFDLNSDKLKCFGLKEGK